MKNLESFKEKGYSVLSLGKITIANYDTDNSTVRITTELPPQQPATRDTDAPPPYCPTFTCD